MPQETLFPVSDFDSSECQRGHRPLGAPRVQEPVRDQVEFITRDLDSLVAPDHQVRMVWAFVEEQDLSALYDLIQARTNTPGRSPIGPHILLALWVNATLDGVGTAREVERRCQEDIAYQWICGGVSVNYHTLSDFRVAHVDFLDALLTKNVAALLAEGLVEMNRVAQDGMRVRASAGAASYRRRPTLERCYEQAESQVEALRHELEQDPGAGDRRQKAARRRAARERQERLGKALEKMKELEKKEASKPPSKKKDKTKLRVSMTDPVISTMKMADGGFRPAVNVQFGTDTKTQVISGADVSSVGSDHGLMPPMVDQHDERYGRYPQDVLVDGGFSKCEDIDYVSQPEIGCTVYAPVYMTTNSKQDPHQRKKGDSEAVAQWRERMGTEQAKEIYKERAATAECVNAIARNRNLWRFTVRGLRKIKAVVLLYVLAHNLRRANTLRAARA